MTLFSSLISCEQLTPTIVAEIFAEADAMRKICEAGKRSNLLEDKIVALIFLEPSSRTMLSFQAATARLNAGALLLQGAESSSVKKGESIEDTMKVVSGYADLIVARLSETGAAPKAAAACSVPFINAGDGAAEHPTQALIDAYTIYHELGTLEGLHIGCGFDPRHSRTIHSLVKLMSQYKGVSFTFVSPEALQAPKSLLDLLNERGVVYRQVFTIDGLADADVIYLNRLQEERFVDRALFEHHRRDLSLKPEMVTPRNRLIMDPLPRIDEISVAVDDLPAAAYFRQTRNGVPVRMALLKMMLGFQILAI